MTTGPVKLDLNQVRQMVNALVLWLTDRYEHVNFLRVTSDGKVSLDDIDGIRSDDQVVFELLEAE